MYKTTTDVCSLDPLMLRNGWDIAPKPLSHWADALCAAAVATFFVVPPLFSLSVVVVAHSIYAYDTWKLLTEDCLVFHPPVRDVFYDYLLTYAAAQTGR